MSKVNWKERMTGWFKRKDAIKIPEMFARIKQKELVPGDIILFYHGNKLTEAHGEWMRSKKYGHVSNAPYHAAIVYDLTISGETIILDPELTTSFSPLTEYTLKEGQRIDIIRYPATDERRKAIRNTILEIAEKEGMYDAKGYGAFIAQLPFMGWVKKIIRPSNKTWFCSDAVTYAVEHNGIKVSEMDNNNTAPVDLLIYGLENYDLYTLKTRGEHDEDTR